jgi:2-pyrone-4,6-dicarboxylate lactonase
MNAVDLKLHARRKPTFQLPMGACDAHCHVFGPGNIFPYAPNRRYTPADAPKETLAELHKFLGVSRAVIVQASCHGSDNRAMLDALTHSPATLRGVAIADGNTPDEEYKTLHAAGVRGVRFNFVKHLGGAPAMDVFWSVLRKVEPLGWHIVLHMDAKDIESLTPLIKQLPMPFVIDHMGRVESAKATEQPAFRALLGLVAMPNCWIKVSGSERISFPPYDAAIPFARALVDAAPDRCLWGTDFPHPNPTHEADEADLVDLIPKFAPDAAVQKKLLVDNPARLYEF